MLVVDEAGVVLYANNTAEQLLGLARGDSWVQRAGAPSPDAGRVQSPVGSDPPGNEPSRTRLPSCDQASGQTLVLVLYIRPGWFLEAARHVSASLFFGRVGVDLYFLRPRHDRRPQDQ